MTKISKKQKKQETTAKVTTCSFLKNESFQFIAGLVISFSVVFLAFSFISFFFTGAEDQSRVENLSLLQLADLNNQVKNWSGGMGAYLSYLFMHKWFGVSSFFILFFFITVGLRLMKAKTLRLFPTFFVCSLGLIWGSLTLGYLYSLGITEPSFFYLGGAHGYYMSKWLVAVLGQIGAPIIILLIFLSFLAVVSRNTIYFIRTLLQPSSLLHPKENYLKNKLPEFEIDPCAVSAVLPAIEESTLPSDKEDEYYEPEPAPQIVQTIIAREPESAKVDTSSTPKPEPEVDFTIEAPTLPSDSQMSDEFGNYDPKLDLSKYKYPEVSLLIKYDSDLKITVDEQEQKANMTRITDTLNNYNIGIDRISATVGPTVTLYEVVPKPGVRISKIKNLEDDIALSLAALGIRIIAPIPGRGTIGIEVPNQDPKVVSIRSIIASKKFQESKYDLPIAFGKTIANEIFMVDLAKAPHMLVAGATGQGKSVGLNAIITSLLYKKHPSELKFVLIDPKKVEFGIYSHLERHFLAKLPNVEEAVITDVTKVVETLKSLCIEMDSRYDLLKKAGSVRNIKEYNEMFVQRRLNPQKGHKYMPYIVVIIDEFGDLIMTAGKEVELPIARIAQLARAIGIHMIIATQRPSTNIITGMIKANFPARVAFRVIQMVDSRTIIDSPGANQLIGRGDMLYSQGSDMTRIQCALVETKEVSAISSYISNQQGYTDAYLLPECPGESADSEIGAVDLTNRDSMFEEAARLVVAHQQGSTSLVQRKFSIGYNRAGRIIDQLEVAGVIGPFEGAKARQVLVQDEMHLQNILDDLKR